MNIRIEFTRGEIVYCHTCLASAIVIKKNQLPDGWFALLETTKARETHARLVCPQCNTAEVERWNPER